MTDDRNVADSIKQGTMNTHVQLAIRLGAPPEAAGWPAWATHTINVGCKLKAKDFEIGAPRLRRH